MCHVMGRSRKEVRREVDLGDWRLERIEFKVLLKTLLGMNLLISLLVNVSIGIKIGV